MESKPDLRFRVFPRGAGVRGWDGEMYGYGRSGPAAGRWSNEGVLP
jgi:hypothetical protein